MSNENNPLRPIGLPRVRAWVPPPTLVSTSTRDPNDTRSVEEQLEPEQYARRDAALKDYITDHPEACVEHNARIQMLIKNAFNAGWAARKKTELEMALGIDTRR